MSERFQCIKIYGEQQGCRNCPVLLQKSGLLFDSVKSLNVLQFKFINLQHKNIEALNIKIQCFDLDQNPLGGHVLFQYRDLNIGKNESFGEQTPIYLSQNDARKFNIYVKKVYFDDDSYWEGDALLRSLSPQTDLEEFGELKQQFLIELKKVWSKTEGNIYPEELEDFWYCTCGAVNLKSQSECIACDISKDKLFSLSDFGYLLERKKEREEQEALTVQKKKRVRRKRRIALISCAGAIAALCAGIFLYIEIIRPNNLYQQANIDLENGNYVDARNIYIELGEYKDSGNKQVEARYLEAEKSLELKRFDEAEKIYEELNNYKDSQTKKLECIYQKADELLENEKYTDAIKLYTELGEYKDSPFKIEESNFKLAQFYMGQGELKEAYSILKEIKQVDLLDDYQETYNECRYQIAQYNMKHKNIQTAYKEFVDIIRYKDSRYQAATCAVNILSSPYLVKEEIDVLLKDFSRDFDDDQLAAIIYSAYGMTLRDDDFFNVAIIDGISYAGYREWLDSGKSLISAFQ
ncbi:tetratricopeptide repeat protein [Diplocloster agilis]|uniref:tetratricopeptide repeat protein n=1 Tax=Diplocloster agilis TaxID=2850323 RepID=UPI00082186B1|nr:tetratricopeptide repeat protein [Suonthocola fibrivorans]MCU6733443.1 tetratricopeptide repeat protein [Suonthocola fibrivorans]SCI93434.1 DNA uptake lipoprotein [uncultured Clostridium sp.]